VSDSLVLAGQFELLGGGVVSTNPACPGAVFRLDDGWDFGSPQPVPALIAAMALDGEKPTGRRVSNRTMVIPVVIQAPSLLLVEAAREVLLAAVAAEQWIMTYTADAEGGTPLPLVFDCYAATASAPVYSLAENRSHLAHLAITFPAAPYGRSDLPEVIDFPAPILGRPTPPVPVDIDTFASVSGTQWAQTLIGPGPQSAHWDPSISPANNPSGVGLAPLYTKTGLTLNLCNGWDLTVQSTGTTTSAPVLATAVANGGVSLGDRFQLKTSGGALIQPQVFTVTGFSTPVAGVQSMFFTPAALAAPVSTNHCVQTGPSDLSALTVYAGFGSSKYFSQWAKAGGSVQFQFTLTDGTTTVAFNVTRKGIKGSNNSGTPIWYKIQVPIPQNTAVNMTTITGYTVKVVASGTNTLPYTDLYLDTLQAVPVPVATIAPQRGQVHTLSGIKGTARGPASWQFQQQGAGTLVTKVYDQPGTFFWLCPPGVSSYAGFAIGAGGDGAPFLANGGGAGSGGSSAVDPAVACTQGNLYKIVVGKRGASPTAGGLSSFAGDSVTRTAPGGLSATTSTGAVAPAAGFGGFAGGAGGNGVAGNNGGGGGGGSAGSTGAGGLGGNASGVTGGSPGAAGTGTAGQTGAPGGRGGTFNVGNGSAPTVGYGAGMGGSPPGFGRRDYGGFTDGVVKITYLQPPAAKTLIFHRPGWRAPDTLCPFISIPVTDVPDGTVEYPVQSMLPSINARFDGTYTVLAINAAWNTPSSSRNLFVTFKEYEQPGTSVNTFSTATKTFVPNTDPDVSKNGIVNLGEITLPQRKLPAENLAARYTMTITDSNTSDDWYDVLLLDSQGSTVVVNSDTAYTNYFVDEPGETDFGMIMGSLLDRTDAVSVTAQCLSISGPPPGVDPEGNQLVLVYAVEGAPAVYMTYYPRWRISRTA